MNDARQRRIVVLLFMGTALLSLLFLPCVGSHFIVPLSGLTDVESHIFWELRVPRVLLAAAAGGALAISGAVLQALFRNPLAEPYTLGISGGASVGAVIAIVCGWTDLIGPLHGPTWCAMAGAGVTVAFLFLCTRAHRESAGVTVLLAGIAVNALAASVILFLQSITNMSEGYRIFRWFIGGLDTVGYSTVVPLFVITILGAILLFYQSGALDVLLSGEEFARGRGVSPERVLALCVFGTSVLVAVTVSFVGPIGFVGLVIPHICRGIVGTAHRLLLPVSFLCGMSFLTICDTAARTIIAPGEIPVGVLTSLIGTPIFVALLLRKRIV